MGSVFIDMSGQKFNRLTPQWPAGKRRKIVFWLATCDCGAVVIAQGSAIRNGHVKSCGCLRRDRATRHGLAGSRTYRSWNQMLQRCTNQRCRHWNRYGGRGITVCGRWLRFENFLADMRERPEGMTLDRFPNNDGNYEPGNCRWATPKEQQNNMRTNRHADQNCRNRV